MGEASRLDKNLLTKMMDICKCELMYNYLIFTTHIFMVPLGPKLVFITSCIPFAAEIFTANACAARANSALGFNKLIAAIMFEFI